MEEADRREFLTHLIEMVGIYEEEQPNGQWLKSITFKLPIIPHDMEISLDNGSQVETVVQLSKGSVPSQDVKVKFSMENVCSAQYLDKPATYEQIKAYVKEHSGFNVSSLYIAQVKQKYGIIERDCYNLPKSDDSRQPKCPEHKEEAIVKALTYYKMI